MAAYTYETHAYDVVVVGAGGAGLRATLGEACDSRIRCSRGVCADFGGERGLCLESCLGEDGCADGVSRCVTTPRAQQVCLTGEHERWIGREHREDLGQLGGVEPGGLLPRGQVGPVDVRAGRGGQPRGVGAHPAYRSSRSEPF